MPIKAPLPLKTSKNEHAIRKFIPKNLFKAFQIISRKLQYQNPESRKLRSFKPVSQNLGTSNAKTHNTKLIGHKTRFPKQQAPSIDSKKRESYAQNTQTAEQKTDSNLSLKLLFPNHLTNTISTQPHRQQHATTTTTIPQLQPHIITIKIDSHTNNKVVQINNKNGKATTPTSTTTTSPRATTRTTWTTTKATLQHQP